MNRNSIINDIDSDKNRKDISRHIHRERERANTSYGKIKIAIQ